MDNRMVLTDEQLIFETKTTQIISVLFVWILNNNYVQYHVVFRIYTFMRSNWLLQYKIQNRNHMEF